LAEHLALPRAEPCIAGVVEDPQHPPRLEAHLLSRADSTDRGPTCGSQRLCGLPGREALLGHRKDHADYGRASRVDLKALADGVVRAHGYDYAIPVDADPGVCATSDHSAQTSRHGSALALGVQMISLAGNHGIEEVSEGVAVLQRADRHVGLACPQRELDDMTSHLAIPAGEAIAVLDPQLRARAHPCEFRRVAHRACEARASVIGVCGNGLVAVFRGD